MNVDKAQIISVLTSRGDIATAVEADMSLPARVDVDRDTDLLDRFGVAVRDLVRPVTGPRRVGD